MKAAEFIAEAFAVRTIAHELHLKSTSYAEHVAVGGFYDGLPGLIDDYAEVYQGLHGLIKQYPDADATCNCTPIELVQSFLELIPQAPTNDSPALENILAEMEQLAAQTLYKLRFLK